MCCGVLGFYYKRNLNGLNRAKGLQKLYRNIPVFCLLASVNEDSKAILSICRKLIVYKKYKKGFRVVFTK